MEQEVKPLSTENFCWKGTLQNCRIWIWDGHYFEVIIRSGKVGDGKVCEYCGTETPFDRYRVVVAVATKITRRFLERILRVAGTRYERIFHGNHETKHAPGCVRSKMKDEPFTGEHLKRDY